MFLHVPHESNSIHFAVIHTNSLRTVEQILNMSIINFYDSNDVSISVSELR